MACLPVANEHASKCLRPSGSQKICRSSIHHRRVPAHRKCRTAQFGRRPALGSSTCKACRILQFLQEPAAPAIQSESDLKHFAADDDFEKKPAPLLCDAALIGPALDAQTFLMRRRFRQPIDGTVVAVLAVQAALSLSFVSPLPMRAFPSFGR